MAPVFTEEAMTSFREFSMNPNPEVAEQYLDDSNGDWQKAANEYWNDPTKFTVQSVC